MSDLAGRIAARLDALEAGARAAGGQGALWHESLGGGIHDEHDGYVVDYVGDEDASKHIAAWDPAAVLRLVDGLRAVVAMHPPNDNRPQYCDTCGDPYFWDQTPPEPWPCPTLFGIAAALGVEDSP